jgi:hypothetical protein
MGHVSMSNGKKDSYAFPRTHRNNFLYKIYMFFNHMFYIRHLIMFLYFSSVLHPSFYHIPVFLDFCVPKNPLF